jgi:secondary thiamine-phosphate synthase enzyme
MGGRQPFERMFRRLERLPNAQASIVSENVVVIFLDEFETKTGGRLDTVDVTDEVCVVVRSSGVRNGSVLVFSPHTTCCVLIARSGSRTAATLGQAMDVLAPADGYYAHDDLDIRTENLTEDEPANAPAHLFHAFAGKASECIPVRDGELVLGEHQRVLFVELDSSRARRYLIQVVGE